MKLVNRRFTNPAATSPPPGTPTSFEQVVRQLKLRPEDYETSTELREWVFRNKDQRYVPSELLKAFGFEVSNGW